MGTRYTIPMGKARSILLLNTAGSNHDPPQMSLENSIIARSWVCGTKPWKYSGKFGLRNIALLLRPVHVARGWSNYNWQSTISMVSFDHVYTQEQIYVWEGKTGLCHGVIVGGNFLVWNRVPKLWLLDFRAWTETENTLKYLKYLKATDESVRNERVIFEIWVLGRMEKNLEAKKLARHSHNTADGRAFYTYW